MTDSVLDIHQKEVIRKALCESAIKLIGIPYEFGAEWTDLTKLPASIDCSELIENVFKLNGLHMPDGSQAQYNFTVHSPNPTAGDLAFFGRGGKPTEIYHVGLVLNDNEIIEARGFQPNSSFETGKVIIRPLQAWISYKNWIGFQAHPKLT